MSWVTILIPEMSHRPEVGAEVWKKSVREPWEVRQKAHLLFCSFVEDKAQLYHYTSCH